MVTDRLRKLFASFNPAYPTRRRKDSATQAVDADEVIVTEELTPGQASEGMTDVREQMSRLTDAVYNAGPGDDEARVKAALAQMLKPAGSPNNPAGTAAAPREHSVPLPLEVEATTATVPDTLPPEEAFVAPLPPEIQLAVKTVKLNDDKVVLAGDVVVQAGDVQLNSKTTVAASQANAPVAAKAANAPADKKVSTSDMIADIFNSEEVEADPLAALMVSLPKADIRELLDEAREVDALLGEWERTVTRATVKKQRARPIGG